MSRPSRARLIDRDGWCSNDGSGPATMPYPSSSASGVTPSSSAFARLIMITAAAPSEICDAFPAVMVPSFEKAGRSPASDSGVVPGRTPSSVSTMTGSPFRCGIDTGAIYAALARAGLAIGDVDLVEINEAFAAVGIASMRDLGLTTATIP